MDISDWEYNELCKLYYENAWLHHQVNHETFEVLWNDYHTIEEKTIVSKFISNFKYLTNEEAENTCYKGLRELINICDLTPNNTLFIATKNAPFADGSNILQGFIKSILIKIDDSWRDYNLTPSIEEAEKLFSKGKEYFEERNWEIKKIIVMDDFCGTGKTAKKKIDLVKSILPNTESKVLFFSLVRMYQSIKEIEKAGCEHYSCFTLKKGIDLAFRKSQRKNIREKVKLMEGILGRKINDRPLSKHSLGWGKCEALYNWNRFNIPNNVFPMFWWSRYSDGKKRITMFNRMP